MQVATLLDTSRMNIEQAVNFILELYQNNTKKL